MSVTFSTAALAKRYAVNVSKVGEWIRSGELRAINVAKQMKGERPRYRITEEAVAEFEQRRTVPTEADANA